MEEQVLDIEISGDMKMLEKIMSKCKGKDSTVQNQTFQTTAKITLNPKETNIIISID